MVTSDSANIDRPPQHNPSSHVGALLWRLESQAICLGTGSTSDSFPGAGPLSGPGQLIYGCCSLIAGWDLLPGRPELAWPRAHGRTWGNHEQDG